MRPRKTSFLREISEPTVNVELARLLGKRGLDAMGEVIIPDSAYRPDLLLTLNGVRIIIEGKFQRHSARDALEKQCRDRVDKGLCDVAIAVLYEKPVIQSLSPRPEQLTAWLEQATYSACAFFTGKSGVEAYPWQKNITLDTLVDLIRNSYQDIVSTDRVSNVVDSLRSALEGFLEDIEDSGQATPEMAERVREALDLPPIPRAGQEGTEAEEEG